MANTVQKESKVVYLQIGQNYEHLAETKQFDVSEWVEAYPDATIYILFRRPGEDVVAPVQTTLEDGILTWTISNWETGIIGVGFAEIRAIDSTTGLVKKSHVIPCSVEASVTDEDTAPDFPSWIDRMITMNEHLESVYADFNQELADGITAIQDEAAEQKDDAVAAIQEKGDTVIASIPMSYTDLIEALAGATYNANRHYDHDEFVWYDNHLWRRRTDSPSIVGPWNEDDWIRAALTAHVTEALWQVESMQNELYNSIAPAWDYYDTTASYAVGDYVINRERLYRCISPVSGGGDFDYSKWEVVTVAAELQKYVQSDAIAPEYSASTTYRAGQYVWYSGNVYRCKTDISTAEAWTAAHWQLVKIGDELTDLKSAIDIVIDNSYTDMTSVLMLSPFQRGGLDAQGEINSTKYRVVSKNIIIPTENIQIVINSGFRVNLTFYESGTRTGSDWYSGSATLNANNEYRILIARTNDDTTETADVYEFVSNVNIITKGNQRITELNGTVSELSDGLYKADAEIKSNYNEITKGLFHPVMEVGDYNISGGALSPVARSYYVRTANGYNINLHKGDIISLSNYSGFCFYPLVKKAGTNSFVSIGKKTGDFTIADDGEYAVVVGANPIDSSVVYDSPDDINTVLYVRNNESINDRINMLESLEEKYLILSKNILSPFLNAGINSDTGEFYLVDSGKRYAATQEKISIDPTKHYIISWNEPEVKPTYAFIFEYSSTEDSSFIKRTSFSVFEYYNEFQYIPDDQTIAYIRILLIGGADTPYMDMIPTEFQLEVGTNITAYTQPKAINPNIIDPDEQYKRLVNDKSLRYDFFVPEYYTNSGYMSGKVDAVNTYMDSCYATGDCFAFITDAHWGSYNAQNSPALIRYLYDRTPMSKVFDGGDTGNGGDVDDTIMNYCQAIQASVWNRAYFAIGNHEPFNNVASSYISARFDSRREKYNGNPEQHYYYVNNERAKIRYIILACYETGDGNNAFNGIGGSSEASAAQRVWLQNVALNVDSGWAVVIVMHSLYYVSNISPYPIVAEPRYNSTIEIMDNFVNNGGEICCVLQGHTHIDRMTHTPAGIPVFITACDKYVDNETPAGIIVPRPKGTIREQLFDVVCINRNSKIVRLIRIGCPAQNGIDDNVGTEAEYRELSWADEGN